jgi:hypothetical protein
MLPFLFAEAWLPFELQLCSNESVEGLLQELFDIMLTAGLHTLRV